MIIASTRPGRLGLPIANWAISEIGKHDGFEVDVADLALMDLPMLDEPNHPMRRNYTKPHTIAWSERVDAADAILIVTPEYNYGMPGSLKNALDFLYHEWNYKPVAFVSYGGMSGGMRSVQMAKQVVTTLKMVALPEAVNIHMVPKYMHDGQFVPEESQVASLKKVLVELSRWAVALRPMRVTLPLPVPA
ncbi:MAG TPA: NAD(P)H-dependent oxidoreductase [Candidatus Baltobacterales bacterium]|nr:NAD(P)H-dependent oxidoreductase [Candidatus Baltobacterales bacterium]